MPYGSGRVKPSTLLLGVASELWKDRDQTRGLISSALKHFAERDVALTLLGALGEGFTCDVVEELVELALSHRSALQVRRIPGRLPHERADEVVPPATAQLPQRGVQPEVVRQLRHPPKGVIVGRSRQLCPL